MTYKIDLSQDELALLKSWMTKTENIKIYRRLLAIKMKHEKIKNKIIARHLGVTGDTVRNWVKLYLNEGFAGLCHLGYKGRISKLEPHFGELKEFLDNRLVEKIAVIQDYMLENHNLVLSRWAFGDFLKKKLGFSFKKQN